MENEEFTELGEIPSKNFVPSKAEQEDKLQEFEEFEEFEELGEVPSGNKIKSVPSSEFEEFEELGEVPSKVAPEVLASPKDQTKSESSWYNPFSWQWLTKSISQEELDALAKKHNVPVERLSSSMEFLGGQREGAGEETIGSALSFLGNSVGQGLPQWLYVEAQEDGVKEALTELRSLAEDREGVARTITEVAAGAIPALAASGVSLAAKVPGAISKAINAVPNLAKIAGSGALGGFFSTNDKEEGLQRAFIGAGIGSALYGAGKIAQKGIKKVDDVVDSFQKSDDIGEEGTKLFLKERAAVEADTAPTRQTIFSGPEGRLSFEELEAQQIKLPTKQLEEEVERFRSKLSPEANQALSDELVNLKLPVEKQAGYIFLRKVEEDVIDFASTLSENPFTSIKKAKAFLKEKEVNEGSEFLRNAFENFRSNKAADNLLKSGVGKALPGNVGPFSKAHDMLKDARITLTGIDRRLNTQLAPLLDTLSINHNKMTQKLTSAIPELKTLSTAIRDSELTSEQVSHYLRNPRLVPELKPKEQAVVLGWKDWFEGQRQAANQLYKQEVITRFKNKQGELAYVPHMIKPREDVIRAYRNAFADVKNQTGVDLYSTNAISAEKIAQLQSNPTFNGLVESTRYLGRLGENGKLGPEVITSTYNKLIRGGRLLSDVGDALEASATHQRTWEEVPALIREENVIRLGLQWMMNTNKHIYYRDAFQELSAAEKLARKNGDGRAARYLSNLAQDIRAPRSRDTIANHLTQVKYLAHATLDKLAEESGKPAVSAIAKLLSEDSAVVRVMFNSIYPNFLGGSVRAALNNLTQPLLLTVPELGYKYGTRLYWNAIKSSIKGGPITVNSLQRDGVTQSQYFQEFANVLKLGLEKQTAGSVSERVLQNYTQGMMYMFDTAEKANRLVVSNMANDVTEDLLNNAPQARDFLRRMDAGSRRHIMLSRDSGDKKAVQEAVRDYLIGKTLFNYNKASASEMARELGPVLAMFSKWPTAIYGDIADNFEKFGVKEGSMQVTKKYVAPFFGLMAIQTLLSANTEGDKGAERQLQAVTGKAGLSGAAPLGSVGALVKGDIIRPPTLQVPIDFVDAISGIKDGDSDEALNKVGKALSRVYDTFGVGAGAIRMLGTDIPLMLGEESAGKTTFSRLGITED